MAPAPHYASPRATLYVGDCREVAPQLPARSVDLMIADPPRESYGHAWDGSDNPYAGPYGDLVRAEMERLEWSTWAA